MLSRYLLALLLTIAIEVCVAYGLGFRTGRFMLAVVMINVATQPALNYLLLLLRSLNVEVSLLLIVALEILVVIIEWRLLVYIFREPRGRFLLTSGLANTISFLAGLLIFWT